MACCGPPSRGLPVRRSSRLSLAWTLAALGAVAPATAASQAVKIEAGRIMPFEGIGVVPKGAAGTNPAKGANGVTLYAAAFLGPPGAIGDLPAGAQVHFHYATVHLLFSAAALPTVQGSEVKALGNLAKLNGHVQIVPLDSEKKPIEDHAALQVLAILPDSMATAVPSTDSTSTSVTGAAFGAATRTFVPQLEAGLAVGKRVGPVVAKFSHLFHRPSAHTQIAYMSDIREFGWMWYEHDSAHIEGTHRTSAALEVAPSVRYLELHLRVVGDWRSHGAWQREVTIVLDMGSGTP